VREAIYDEPELTHLLWEGEGLGACGAGTAGVLEERRTETALKIAGFSKVSK